MRVDSVFDGFDFQNETHVLANNQAASLHDGVELETVVKPVDTSLRFDAYPLRIAHGGCTNDFALENDFFGRAANGKIAHDFELAVTLVTNFLCHETQFRMVLGVKKVVRAKVVVTALILRIDTCRLDYGFGAE